MKRFQFLLNCCEPGTIPDASILAAALDLVSGWKDLPIPLPYYRWRLARNPKLDSSSRVVLWVLPFKVNGKREENAGEVREEKGKESS